MPGFLKIAYKLLINDRAKCPSALDRALGMIRMAVRRPPSDIRFTNCPGLDVILWHPEDRATHEAASLPIGADRGDAEYDLDSRDT